MKKRIKSILLLILTFTLLVGCREKKDYIDEPDAGYAQSEQFEPITEVVEAEEVVSKSVNETTSEEVIAETTTDESIDQAKSDNIVFNKDLFCKVWIIVNRITENGDKKSFWEDNLYKFYKDNTFIYHSYEPRTETMFEMVTGKWSENNGLLTLEYYDYWIDTYSIDLLTKDSIVLKLVESNINSNYISSKYNFKIPKKEHDFDAEYIIEESTY